MSGTAAVSFAVVAVGLYGAHEVADQWVQTHAQACGKGAAGWSGRWACVRHVASYTTVTAGVVAVLWAVLDLSIAPAGFAVGQVVSAVTHYWADRRTTLARLAQAIGKGDYYRLGASRPGRDDNPTIGTGAYALDQSWHLGWLLVAALLTATIGAPGMTS